MSLNKKEVVSFVNSVLFEASRRTIKVTHIKLQKLLYLCYGHYAAKSDGEKISDVSFQAWLYGPVIEEVYYEFKRFGDGFITEACTFSGDQHPYVFGDDFEMGSQVIDDVFNKYGHMTAFDLVDITHKKDGAWSKAHEKGEKFVITHESIVDEFKQAASS